MQSVEIDLDPSELHVSGNRINFFICDCPACSDRNSLELWECLRILESFDKCWKRPIRKRTECKEEILPLVLAILLGQYSLENILKDFLGEAVSQAEHLKRCGLVEELVEQARALVFFAELEACKVEHLEVSPTGLNRWHELFNALLREARWWLLNNVISDVGCDLGTFVHMGDLQDLQLRLSLNEPSKRTEWSLIQCNFREYNRLHILEAALQQSLGKQYSIILFENDSDLETF